jgi:hypothetical protein
MLRLQICSGYYSPAELLYECCTYTVMRAVQTAAAEQDQGHVTTPISLPCTRTDDIIY